MAGLKIEGNVSQISERQLEFIKSVIVKQGYDNCKVTIKPLGQDGDNYMATVKRIIVEDGKGNTLRMVVKVGPQEELLRFLSKTALIFRNEHIMYTKVLPKFTQLEKAAEVPLHDRLRYAKCYGSLDEEPNEVIILEDLDVNNFIMLDRFKPLGVDCIKSVLKNFALLHSLSYVLKNKDTELFNEFKESFFDMFAHIESQEEKMYFKNIESNACTIVENDYQKRVIKGAVMDALKQLAKNSLYEKDSKHSVIQQGDAWTNNIMFKYDGEILEESIMIDYQISKVTNPCADLLYMIFNCTDYKMRKEYFHEWIDYYHTELDKSLSYHGLKANFVYPRDLLDADLKRYAKIAFGQSIVLAGIFSMKTEEGTTLKAVIEKGDVSELIKSFSVSDKDPETITIFKNKIEGIIESCREFGLF